MRDILVILFTCGSAVLALFRPWMGVLALAVLAYLNPHRYAWGISREMSPYLIVFIGTTVGLMLNHKERQPFPWTRETVLFVLLLCWFTLTTFTNPDFPIVAHTQYVKVMKIYLGVFPMFWLINDYRKLRWLLITVSLSFGFIGFKGGVFALATGFNYRVWGPENTFYGGNNEIGLVLCMMLPLLLLFYNEVEKKWAKYLFLSTFAFSACAIISTWSRGALLTICAVLGLILLRSKSKLLAIPIFLIIFIFAIPNLPTEWFDRMNTISTYEEDASAMGRIEVWGYAFDRAVSSPLRGGGFETFYLQPHDAHSAYFEILGEHGFVALFLWLSLVFGTIYSLWRTSITSRDLVGFEWVSRYASALQISLVGYAVGSVFLGTAYWEILYQLIGICALIKVFVGRAVKEQQAAIFVQGQEVAGAKAQTITHNPLV